MKQKTRILSPVITEKNLGSKGGAVEKTENSFDFSSKRQLIIFFNFHFSFEHFIGAF